MIELTSEESWYLFDKLPLVEVNTMEPWERPYPPPLGAPHPLKPNTINYLRFVIWATINHRQFDEGLNRSGSVPADQLLSYVATAC